MSNPLDTPSPGNVSPFSSFNEAATCAIALPVYTRSAFTEMSSRWQTFDHGTYQQYTEGITRAYYEALESYNVSLVILTPDDVEEYAQDLGCDPDSPECRTQLLAEAAVSGDGWDLAIEQMFAYAHAVELLDDALLSEPEVVELSGSADSALEALLDTAQMYDETHIYTFTVVPASPPVQMVIHLHSFDGEVHVDSSLVALHAVMCVALLYGGSLTMRSMNWPDFPPEDAFPTGLEFAGFPPSQDFVELGFAAPALTDVRAYYFVDGSYGQLSEAEVFNAYCMDADSGEPIPPEPDVNYVGYDTPTSQAD